MIGVQGKKPPERRATGHSRPVNLSPRHGFTRTSLWCGESVLILLRLYPASGHRMNWLDPSGRPLLRSLLKPCPEWCSTTIAHLTWLRTLSPKLRIAVAC